MKLVPAIIALLMTFPALALETEPNNSRQEASALTLTELTSGSIDSADDVDWWKITIERDGVFDLNAVSDLDLIGTFYNWSGSIIMGVFLTMDTGSSGLGHERLHEGVYYLKVSTSSRVGDYSLRASLTPGKYVGDSESNNFNNTAVPIEFDTVYTGQTGHTNGPSVDSDFD